MGPIWTKGAPLGQSASMSPIVLTGASRGIGRALALAGRTEPLILVARDEGGLSGVARTIEARGGKATIVPADLSSVAGARALGERLCDLVEPGATLIHNAGIWPSRLERTGDLERAFVVNGLAPLALQAPLLAAGRLARVLLVSAGLIVQGRFDPRRTPAGDDFSAFRTYCTTKLFAAVALRDAAALHPDVDFLAVHPGVVNTDLGARGGLLGALLRLAKRRMETPETCAARLSRILDRPRWSPPGDAAWWFEETEQPWPGVAADPKTRRAVRETAERLLR